MPRIALLVWCIVHSAAAMATSAVVPDVAYQAGRALVPPPTKPQAHARLEELVPLPSPPDLPRPVLQLAVASTNDVWDRIRRGFAMPELTGPLVDRQQDYFLKRPDVLKAILQRSRRYLYHVVTALEGRRFPTELALLPMVESGYNPHALSSAQAAGLWQFIPDTGKRYQLAQNDSYDGRRDVLASTRAALDYLQFLYGMFGDWQLALASYNWGENAVLGAVERNRARGRRANYESLTLPEETRLYLPKLQALRNIIANPEAFGLTLDPLPNEPYFVAIENIRDLDMRTAAKVADMSLQDFVALNPAFNGGVISAAHSSWILIPLDKVEVFRNNLRSMRPHQLTRPRVHPTNNVATTLRVSSQE